MLHTFAYIETGALISCTLFITVFQKDASLSVSLLWQLLITTFLCVCGSLIYPNRNISKKLSVILVCLHYLYINAVVFGCAYFFNWFDVTNIKMAVFLFLSVTVTFLTLAWIIWHQSRRMTELLNYRLREYQNNKRVL